MKHCDVCVIGTGPGGYVAAIRAAQRGARVVVIEREELGGVCLNWGCIPAKTLIHTAEMYRKTAHFHEIGLDIDGIKLNLRSLLEREAKVIDTNKRGVEHLFKANGIELVRGEARVTAPGCVEVGEECIEAASIIVAAGSSPAQLPGLEMDGKLVVSSTEALALGHVPERIAVIGAGALGAEFASVWNIFGAHVTLIEMMPEILPREDSEIAAVLHQIFTGRGMDVRAGTKVGNMTRHGNWATLELEGAHAGTIEADLVLIGIGREYHSGCIDPSLKMELGKHGKILTNEYMETSVPGIYAVGDVTGKTLLAHGASSEGIVAAVNATGGRQVMNYRVVPACTFTSPEVASVGMTEAEAIEAGHEVRVGRFQFAASGRAHAVHETGGLVKIVGDATTDELLGAHIVGPEAGELIAAPALAMSMEATVEDIIRTIHTHPTLSEALLEAAEDAHAQGIHTPPKRSAQKAAT